MHNLVLTAAPGRGDPRLMAAGAATLMNISRAGAATTPEAVHAPNDPHAEAAESRQNRTTDRRQRQKDKQALQGEFGSAAVTMAAERKVSFGSRAFAREVGRESLGAARTEQRMNFRETLREHSLAEPRPQAIVTAQNPPTSDQGAAPTNADAETTQQAKRLMGQEAASETRSVAKSPEPSASAAPKTGSASTSASTTPVAPQTQQLPPSPPLPQSTQPSHGSAPDASSPAAARSSAPGPAPQTAPQNAVRPPVDAGRIERAPQRPISIASKPADSAEHRANIDRVSRAILTRLRLDQGSFKMRLDPRELGEIRVEMHVRRDEVTVRILAETQMAQRLLEGETEALREGLAGHGLRIERIDVQPLPDAPEGFGEGSFAGWDEARREGDAADRAVAERPLETSREARSPDDASDDADSGDEAVLAAESRVNVWA